MNVGGVVLLFIGVVLVWAGFTGTYKNWYSIYKGGTGAGSTFSSKKPSSAITGSSTGTIV